MFLGSSLGNFSRAEGAAFLRSLPLRRGYGDTLLLGLDHDNEAAKIETAYDDPKGYTRRFIMNGLKAAGITLGDERIFEEENWEYVGKYNEGERMQRNCILSFVMQLNSFIGRHEAYYKSKSDQDVCIPLTHDIISFLADEMMQVEVSYKVSRPFAFCSLFTVAI